MWVCPCPSGPFLDIFLTEIPLMAPFWMLKKGDKMTNVPRLLTHLGDKVIFSHRECEFKTVFLKITKNVSKENGFSVKHLFFEIILQKPRFSAGVYHEKGNDNIFSTKIIPKEVE